MIDPMSLRYEKRKQSDSGSPGKTQQIDHLEDWPGAVVTKETKTGCKVCMNLIYLLWVGARLGLAPDSGG